MCLVLEVLLVVVASVFVVLIVVITFVALKFYKKRTTCYFNFLHDLRVTVDCFL